MINLQTDDNRFGMLDIMIKIGEVSSVDYEKGTARVIFDDDDGLVSNDLAVIQRNTFSNHDYTMPSVGEDVICLFLASGSEAGFILGAIYAGEVEPPESAENKRYVHFADDTKFSYDWENHLASVEIGDDTTIVADQDHAEVKAGGVTLTLSDNTVTIDCDKVNLTSQSGINLGEENPAEFVALATKVKTELTKIQSEFQTLQTLWAAHTHPTGVGPSGPPVTPYVPQYSASDVAASVTKAK